MIWNGNFLRNRVLFHARARAYDASRQVEWVGTTMYDREETVDAYDTALTDKKLSTFNSATELEFLDMIEALDIRSVLDLGCGAGAFYHLLASSHPDLRYRGYDLSKAQIARARVRFGDHFEVRDVSTIEQAEFAGYDAVHIYSVLSFMPVRDQLKVLRRILRSGAKLLMETGCTMPDVRYAPRSCFKDFSGPVADGRTLMTAISFPFRAEMDRTVAGTGHVVTYAEGVYSATRALNNSNRAGGALADKAELKRKNDRFETWQPFKPQNRLLTARIAPLAWESTKIKDYASIPKDQVQSDIVSRLRPLPSNRGAG